jgi:hypothetical protein
MPCCWSVCWPSTGLTWPGAGRNQLRLAELATFSLPLAAWGIFATLYYGSPLPHSVAAKLAVYHLSAEKRWSACCKH